MPAVQSRALPVMRALSLLTISHHAPPTQPPPAAYLRGFYLLWRDATPEREIGIDAYGRRIATTSSEIGFHHRSPLAARRLIHFCRARGKRRIKYYGDRYRFQHLMAENRESKRLPVPSARQSGRRDISHSMPRRRDIYHQGMTHTMTRLPVSTSQRDVPASSRRLIEMSDDTKQHIAIVTCRMNDKTVISSSSAPCLQPSEMPAFSGHITPIIAILISK